MSKKSNFCSFTCNITEFIRNLFESLEIKNRDKISLEIIRRIPNSFDLLKLMYEGKAESKATKFSMLSRIKQG